MKLIKIILYVYLLFATMMKDSATIRMQTLAMISERGSAGGSDQTLQAPASPLLDPLQFKCGKLD